MNYRGARRINATHQSTTVRMRGCKRKAWDARRSSRILGPVLTENRSGLVVDTRVTPADGYGEREAALGMLAARPGDRLTLGDDKGFRCSHPRLKLTGLLLTTSRAVYFYRLGHG